MVLENIQVIAKPHVSFYYGQTVVLENIQVIAKPHVSFYYGQTVVLENIQVIAKPHVSFYYGQTVVLENKGLKKKKKLGAFCYLFTIEINTVNLVVWFSRYKSQLNMKMFNSKLFLACTLKFFNFF